MKVKTSRDWDFVCKKCGWHSVFWGSLKPVAEDCRQCYPIDMMTNCKGERIPSWRLHIDDMEDGEVLQKGVKIPGMPIMSQKKWKEYYSKEHEVSKRREYKKKKDQLAKEVLG